MAVVVAHAHALRVVQVAHDQLVKYAQRLVM
jgi:hypothetical protein